MAEDPDNLSRYLAQTGVNEHARFILELEFIQCLANPHYLNWLAQNKYLEEKAFLNYLKYLEYWRQPQYAAYIRFPHCLAMLDLLQSEHFRQAIASPVVMDEVHTQQAFYWMHYRTNRIKEATAAAAAAAAQASQAEEQQAGKGNGQVMQQRLPQQQPPKHSSRLCEITDLTLWKQL